MKQKETVTKMVQVTYVSENFTTNTHSIYKLCAQSTVQSICSTKQVFKESQRAVSQEVFFSFIFLFFIYLFIYFFFLVFFFFFFFFFFLSLFLFFSFFFSFFHFFFLFSVLLGEHAIDRQAFIYAYTQPLP